MADSVATKYIYPPNYSGTNGHRRYVINCTNKSDGTGEVDVVKADRSAIYAYGGASREPAVATKLVVEKIEYTVAGNMTVTIEWDYTTNEVIAVLKDQSGTVDFTKQGGAVPSSPTGGTGDIVFTTQAAPNASYNITLHLVAKG